MSGLKLVPSPRLYVPAAVADNLGDRLHSPFLAQGAAQVLRDADWLVRSRPLSEGSGASYSHVTRAIDSHMQCLTCAWVLTRERRYRRAAIRHLANLATFHQISCEANASTPRDPILPFCLSYGELSCTVGLMFDLLRADMDDAEHTVFRAVLDRFLMKAAVMAVAQPPWWANQSWSNWNGVCAGGMGVLALAFYDDHPDAPRLIPFVEKSLDAYFRSYVQNGGGCPEGTGYWNYGMNYAVRYVLSWESATRRRHPALRIRQLATSLRFPLDFTGITFGDNDGWHPASFFFLLARRLHRPTAALSAATHLLGRTAAVARRRRGDRVEGGDLLYAADCIPTQVELERLRSQHTRRRVPVAHVYPGMDWAALADDEAFPRLRMAVRGGSSVIAGHGMIDLLSIRCRVNGELMITDQQDGGYMATTFTRRGHEVYGRSIASKSSLFVDGLGCAAGLACDRTETVRGAGLLGVRADASHAFLPRWKDVFVGRLVLMVDLEYWVVIDQVRGASAVDRHWLESRFHTLAGCRPQRDGALLWSGQEWLRLSGAALGPAALRESRGMPSQPAVPQTTILRWMGAEAAADNLHAVALVPGRARIALAVRRDGDGLYTVEVRRKGHSARRIRLAAGLRLR